MKSLDGIICIDKPKGFTSFDVIAKLRGIARTKKIGHAGTLDPMATGVLPVFFGRAAKAVDLLENHDKTYVASLRLGITTDTQDITGEILWAREYSVSRERFIEAMDSFLGEQAQIPPMYSAVKINGRRLYDMARKGIEIERKPRKITVYDISLLSEGPENGEYTIEISCSRGTYIRTICSDLGDKLGCGATMTALRRTGACGFGISECLTLEQMQALTDEDALCDRLLPVSSVFAQYPNVYLNANQARHFVNGLELGISQLDIPADTESRNGGRLCVFDEDRRFLGLASADYAEAKLKIIKLFALGASL